MVICSYILVNCITLSLFTWGEHEVHRAQLVHNERQKGWKHGWVCFPLFQGQQVHVLDLQSKVGKVSNFLVNHFNHRASKCWMKTSDLGRSPSTEGLVSGQKACGASGDLKSSSDLFCCRCFAGGTTESPNKWKHDKSKLPKKLPQPSSREENHRSCQRKCDQHSLHRCRIAGTRWLCSDNWWWWHTFGPFWTAEGEDHNQLDRDCPCPLPHRCLQWQREGLASGME